MAKKVLIVDDERPIVQLVASRLRAAGYEVLSAYDGVQGVQAAHREKPDCIILDIRMPAGGGRSVFHNLKMSSATSTIPIIFLTADTSPETKAKAIEDGAEAFLTKPFDADDLLRTIRVLLNE
jgi:DNA-binding response OmpR family regulator